jgi:hypothetical protein
LLKRLHHTFAVSHFIPFSISKSVAKDPASPHHRAGGQAPFTELKRDIYKVVVIFLEFRGKERTNKNLEHRQNKNRK